MRKYIITAAAFVLAFVVAAYSEENDTQPENTAQNYQTAQVVMV